MTTNNFSEKVIKVENQEGGQCFKIYEVRVHIIEKDENWTSNRFLNKEDAEKHADFLWNNLKDLYSQVWVMEQLVWCN